VVIDGPTPAKLRRRVLAREAGRCANPGCHHLADHCHHIVFRSRGGKTELPNEVAVCTTCHALIHAGLLRVSGSASGDLRWLPVAAKDDLGRNVASVCLTADRLPVLQLVVKPASREETPGGTGSQRRIRNLRGNRPASARAESAVADSAVAPEEAHADAAAAGPLDLDELALGLRRLGVPAVRSRSMVRAAIESLPRGEISEANVLRRALASI
jgi:hypothetical protein